VLTYPSGWQNFLFCWQVGLKSGPTYPKPLLLSFRTRVHIHCMLFSRIVWVVHGCLLWPATLKHMINVLSRIFSNSQSYDFKTNMFPKWLVLTYDHWTRSAFNKYEWNFVNPFSSWECKCFSMRSNRTGEKPEEMHIMACWISIHTYLSRTQHFWYDLAFGTSYMFNHHELFSHTQSVGDNHKTRQRTHKE